MLIGVKGLCVKGKNQPTIHETLFFRFQRLNVTDLLVLDYLSISISYTIYNKICACLPELPVQYVGHVLFLPFPPHFSLHPCLYFLLLNYSA